MGIGFGSKDAAARGDPDLWCKGKWQNDVEKKIKGKTFEAQKKHILVGVFDYLVCVYIVSLLSKKDNQNHHFEFRNLLFSCCFSEHFQFFGGSTPSSV